MVGLPGSRAFGGDPLAALKAGAVTAALYAGLYAVPERYKTILITNALNADSFTIYACGAIAIALLLLLGFRGAIWRALT